MARFCSECGKPIKKNANFCTNCGVSITGQGSTRQPRQENRGTVLGRQSNKRMRTKVFILAAVAITIGGWLYLNLPESGNPVIKALPVVVAPIKYPPGVHEMTLIEARTTGGNIVIPLHILLEKKFIKFRYGDPVNGLPLLAFISGEGKIVTAVSLCEPCNSTSFHIRDRRIVCNSCGSTWELNTLKAISGSCRRFPPDALPNTIRGNELHINEQLVARWQRRV